jgi:hypothetical protein
MKTTLFFSLVLGASISLVSCKGDKGELGPQGPQGTQGQQGTAGQNGQNGQTTLTKTTTLATGSTECPHGGAKIEVGLDANSNGVLDASEVIAAQTKVVCNGTPGTANVYYSSWMEVNESKWVEIERQITESSYTDYDSWMSGVGYQTNLYKDTTITYQAEIAMPKLTQAILDQGAVLFYYKDMTAPSNGKVYPYQPWDWNNVGVTNRTSDFSSNSYFSIQNANGNGNIEKEKLVLQTQFFGTGSAYDAALNQRGVVKYHFTHGNAAKRIKYAELKPKTNFAIRYIIIPGGITGKNAPAVDLKDYAAVKKYYNIKD